MTKTKKRTSVILIIRDSLTTIQIKAKLVNHKESDTNTKIHMKKQEKEINTIIIVICFFLLFSFFSMVTFHSEAKYKIFKASNKL